MFKSYSLLFLFLLFLAIFVLAPQWAFAGENTGCYGDPLEYCRIKAGEDLVIDQNIPGFLCEEGDERWIINEGTIDIFVPMKDCVQYADWRTHVLGLKGRGFNVRYLVCSGIANGQQDENCDGTCQWCWDEKCVDIGDEAQGGLCVDECKWCMNGECVNADEGADPGDYCPTIDWACDGVCSRTSNPGVCDPNGACKPNVTDNIASGYVCIGSGEVTQASSSHYCNLHNVCSNGACYGTKYYTSCNGSGSCREATDHTDSVSVAVYASIGYTLTLACGTTGTTLCGYSGYNGCSGSCTKKRDALRCNASHACGYDVGNYYANCSATTHCSSGSCVSGSCDSGYTCKKKCSGGSCVHQSSAQDLFGNCPSQSSFTVYNVASGLSCDSKCQGQSCKTGNCNGSGGCGVHSCYCKSIGLDGTDGCYAWYDNAYQVCTDIGPGVGCSRTMNSQGGPVCHGRSTRWCKCTCNYP